MFEGPRKVIQRLDISARGKIITILLWTTFSWSFSRRGLAQSGFTSIL